MIVVRYCEKKRILGEIIIKTKTGKDRNTPKWNNNPAIYVGRWRYADSFSKGDIALVNEYIIPFFVLPEGLEKSCLLPAINNLVI
jgi:hypothetical protein